MGEHAVFIWPAYGAAAVILIGLVAASLISLRRRSAKLARLEEERSGETKS